MEANKPVRYRLYKFGNKDFIGGLVEAVMSNGETSSIETRNNLFGMPGFGEYNELRDRFIKLSFDEEIPFIEVDLIHLQNILDAQFYPEA